MKKTLYLLPVLILALACTPKVKPVVQTLPAIPQLLTFNDSVAYYLGTASAAQLKKALPESFTLNEKLYSLGVKDGFGEKGMIDEEAGNALMTTFQQQIQEAMAAEQAAKAAAAKKVGTDFLTANAAKEGVMTTASGLQYKVLTEGTGATPTASDQVEVHYEGRLINGEVFDSSYKRGSTATFGVGQVISGWTEALQLMKEGAKYQLYIPSDLAYGNRGSGQKIGPGEVLVFDVELIKVVK